MKYITLAFLCITYLGINAQNSKQTFGLRIAGGAASFLDKALPSRYSARGLSYDMGIFTDIQRKNSPLGLSIEMGYAQKNVKDDYMGYSMNYLSLGLMPNYNFGNEATTVYLGANAAILTSLLVINDYPKGHAARFNIYDVNLLVGFSQKIFTFNDFKVNLDSRFNLGLLNIENYIADNKTQNYGFSVGLSVKKSLHKSK